MLKFKFISPPQEEVIANDDNDQNTADFEQKKHIKKYAKLHRVVIWSTVTGIVIYLFHVRFFGIDIIIFSPPLMHLELILCMLYILSIYFYEKKIAKTILIFIISIFILYTLFIYFIAFGIYFSDD